jgi:hypothetical protein
LLPYSFRSPLLGLDLLSVLSTSSELSCEAFLTSCLAILIEKWDGVNVDFGTGRLKVKFTQLITKLGHFGEAQQRK